MVMAQTYGVQPSLRTMRHPGRVIDDPPRALTRHSRGWQGITAEVVELFGPLRHIEDLRSDRPRLVAILEEVGGRAETRVAPDRPSRLTQSSAHRLAFFPAGTAVWTFAERFRYIRHVVIDFEVEALTERYGLGGSLQFEPRLSFSDAPVWALAHLIAAECVEPGSLHSAYGDSLALVLFRNLFHRDGRERSEGTPRRLPPRRLQRVLDHMVQFNAVNLKDLAALIGLSRSHFGRVFKASTGLTPHRWLVNARVQRAQQFLLETEMSLVGVALASGFSDQSHLTRAFRRLTGQTPGVWRRAHRR